MWVSGGWDGVERHASSELWRGGAWQEGGRLTSPRYQHCVVLAGDGSVLVTGGQAGKARRGAALDTVERYEWGGYGSVRQLPRLNQARWTHACALLPGGAVLVAGGRVTSRPGDELSSAELLQPGAARWRPIAALPQPRLAPSLVLIAGRPRLSGGHYEVNTTGM